MVVFIDDVLDEILPVSDLVGLICDRELFGGLGGGGAVGLTGLVVAILDGLFDFEDCVCLSTMYFDALLSAVVDKPTLFELSILESALDCFEMEDTEGELGTVVRFVVHASGALSRLSECLDLLLSRREIFDNRFLLSFPSTFLLLVFDVVFKAESYAARSNGTAGESTFR